jgi:hypothetical protein
MSESADDRYLNSISEYILSSTCTHLPFFVYWLYIEVFAQSVFLRILYKTLKNDAFYNLLIQTFTSGIILPNADLFNFISKSLTLKFL